MCILYFVAMYNVHCTYQSEMNNREINEPPSYYIHFRISIFAYLYSYSNLPNNRVGPNNCVGRGFLRN